MHVFRLAAVLALSHCVLAVDPDGPPAVRHDSVTWNRFARGFAKRDSPQTIQSGSGLTLQGCFTDSANGRGLANAVPFDGTAKGCLLACKNKGYSICGVEAGNECWGAATLQITNTAGHQLADSRCTVSICAKDSTQYCGGLDAMSVYSSAPLAATSPPTTLQSGHGLAFQDCYTDNVGGVRQLGTRLSSDGTADGCLLACSNAGFALCGIEYYGECWADHYLGTSSVKTDASKCTFTCSNDNTKYCGGSNAFSLYATSSDAVTAIRPVPTPLPSYAGYSYQDCYTDNSAGHRELPNYLGNTGTATGCLDACKAAGSAYCGLEYG
ncbi:hypothetical protein RQP46_007393 [Phenoliferia psychrophenolica]